MALSLSPLTPTKALSLSALTPRLLPAFAMLPLAVEAPLTLSAWLEFEPFLCEWCLLPGTSSLLAAMTKSVPAMTSFEPSGYVTVAVPSAPTVTVVPAGNLSLLALSTLFLTCFFSSSVKWLGSLTVTLSPGTVGVILPASVVSPFWPWTNWSPGMVSFEPSG